MRYLPLWSESGSIETSVHMPLDCSFGNNMNPFSCIVCGELPDFQSNFLI